MNLDEALKNLRIVCEAFKGTLAEHQTLQASLTLVESKAREAKAAIPTAPEAAPVATP